MENHFRLNCPISGDQPITHCHDVHRYVMRGEASKVEDKRCALASLCWKCPYRNGVRVGGPWHKPDNHPFWSSPRTEPANLPPRLKQYALEHTPPRLEDYRRAGFSDVDRELDAFFKKLHGGQKPAPVKAKKKTNPVIPDVDKERADVLTAAVKKERQKSTQSATKTSQASRVTKQSGRVSERKSELPASKPLSLKERAALMRKKKEQTA